MTINREAAELMALRLTNAVDAAHTFAEALRLATVALQETREVPEYEAGFGEARLGVTRVRGFVAWDTGSEQPLFFYINGRGEQTATTDWSDFVPDPDTAALRAEVEVEGSFFPVRDLPRILGNHMRMSREYAQSAKALEVQRDDARAEVERLRSAAAREKIRADAAEALLARVTALLDAPGDDVSCAGRNLTEPGCFAHDLAVRIRAVLALVAADEQAAEGEAPVAPLPTRDEIAEVIREVGGSAREFLLVYGVPEDRIIVSSNVRCIEPGDAANAVIALLKRGAS